VDKVKMQSVHVSEKVCKADTLLSVMLRFLAHSLATLGHWAAASTICPLKDKTFTMSFCFSHT
jgi:hypothetical protein